MLNNEKAPENESINNSNESIITQTKKKLGKDPAFLLYSNDFLSDCVNLTMEERGYYITLIALLHQRGHLDIKTLWLSLGLNHCCKLEDFELSKYLSSDLLDKFDFDKQGKLYAKNFEQIFEERAKFIESRQKNGKKGGRPKITKEKTNIKPNGLNKNNLLEDENESEKVSVKENYYNNKQDISKELNLREFINE